MKPAVEKSILIRVCKSTSPHDVKALDYCGKDVGGDDLGLLFPAKRPWLGPDLDSESNSQSRNDSGEKGVENAWFIMEPADDSDLKISQVIFNLPNEQQPTHPDFPISRSSSCLVKSCLYEFGGIDYTKCPTNTCSREFRFLDLKKHDEGWISGSGLDFNTYGDWVAVVGTYIYMIGPMTVDYLPEIFFAYVYNTEFQQGYLIHDMPNPQLYQKEGLPCVPELWVPLEGQGLLVSFRRDGQFYLHNPVQDTWETLENYEPLPCFYGPRCVSNGILYMLEVKFCSFLLYAYDCYKGRLLYKVQIPQLFKDSKVDQGVLAWICPRLVAVSDSRFCLIWQTGYYLFCARVEVVYNEDSAPSAELLGVQYFPNVKIIRFYNCLTVDSLLGQFAKNSALATELRRILHIS